jgi:hypothetical protein
LSNTNSIFTMHDVPVFRALDSISMKTFQLLMGCGTIDPVNPSLFVLGLGGTEHLYEAGIVVLELSPFAQRVREVGGAAHGDELDLVLNLEPLLDLMGPSCPSLLLSPTLLSPPLVRKLYQLFLKSRNNGWRLLAGVRGNPLNPFRRVGRELRACMAGTGPLADRRLSSPEAYELASLLLQEKAVDLEWKMFILAWDEVCQSAIDADPASKVMDLKSFLTIYEGLQETCRLKWGRGAGKSCAGGSPRPVS